MGRRRSNHSARRYALRLISAPDIQIVVRGRFADLYRTVQRLSGASDEVVREFFAKGMLLNVAAAMDLPAVMGEESWARNCLGA